MELLMRGFIILIDKFNYRKSFDSHSISMKKFKISYDFFAFSLDQGSLERALADFQWYPFARSRLGLDFTVGSI